VHLSVDQLEAILGHGRTPLQGSDNIRTLPWGRYYSSTPPAASGA
jgi:hypothetical protein